MPSTIKSERKDVDKDIKKKQNAILAETKKSQDEVAANSERLFELKQLIGEYEDKYLMHMDCTSRHTSSIRLLPIKTC
ncbi:MAG: hypothetical protein ABS936_07500 [Exiguobacterium indicum]